LHGGALFPVPDSVVHWWQTWGSWHTDLGTGSHAPGPAYLLPLALAATVTFNHPELVVDLIFLLAVPMAFSGALGLLRRISTGNLAPLWGAASYGLLPVLSGAVGQGRIGTVVGAAVLPWVVRAALDLGVEADPEDSEADPNDPDRPPPAAVRRWRAAWRVALLAGLLVSFVPPAWLVLVLLVIFAAVGGFAENRKPELFIITVVPLLLVLPWAVGTLRAPGAWLVEGGRAAALPADPGLWDLVLGRTGGLAEAPAWLAVGLPVAAVIAFLRVETRARVLRVWVVILAAAAVLAATSRVPVSLPGVPVEFRPWPGFLLILIQAGFIAAAAIAADGAMKSTSQADFTWRQPVAAVTVALAVLAPVLGASWWLTHGGEGPMHRHQTAALPTYMRELADGSNTSAVLRISGGLEHGLEYQVLRSGVQRLGDDGSLGLTEPDPTFRALVERLLSTADDGDAALLASYGVKYVYAPAPVADVVSGGFDAANDFGSASAPLHARAWVVQVDPSTRSVADQRAWLRPVWVATCVVTWLVCLVLAAPERKRRRR
jgi:hypothetical protein